MMPALVTGIHVFSFIQESKPWMAGTSPAMTKAARRDYSAASRGGGRIDSSPSMAVAEIVVRTM